MDQSKHYSLSSQIAEVKREIAMREKVYPRLIAGGKMHQDEAKMHLDCMKSVLVTLEEAKANQPK